MDTHKPPILATTLVPPAAPTEPPPGWTLVWRDEFEGSEVDPNRWDFDLGSGFFDYRRHAWVPGWGNEELQYYTREPANVFVRDSVLHIRALRESIHGCGYTSARLKTRRRDGTPLFAQAYGRFEFRARVPSGKGLWPALWMLPLEDRYGGWAASGEIDVMEIVGGRPGEVLGSLHFGSLFPARELVTHTCVLPDGGTVEDWHVYAVEWTPGEVRWLLDGHCWARQDFWWSSHRQSDGVGLPAVSADDLHTWPAPFDQPFYLVMNLAVGGTFPGVPAPETNFPAELLVDYVRVYERAGGPGALVPRGAGRLPFEDPLS
jgi:beta-glucanase (GH16 family)